MHYLAGLLTRIAVLVPALGVEELGIREHQFYFGGHVQNFVSLRENLDYIQDAGFTAGLPYFHPCVLTHLTFAT